MSGVLAIIAVIFFSLAACGNGQGAQAQQHAATEPAAAATLDWTCQVIQPNEPVTDAGVPATIKIQASNSSSTRRIVTSFTVSFYGFGQTQWGNQGSVLSRTYRPWLIHGHVPASGWRYWLRTALPSDQGGPTSCQVTAWF
jgi:hypothetical protein